MTDSTHKKAQKCIWMTAGIISYKLCDREFRCDDCDFDHSMKGIVPQSGKINMNNDDDSVRTGSSEAKNSYAIQFLTDEYLTNLLKNYQLYLDRYYHSDYFWLEPHDPITADVGLDKLVFRLINPVEKIILPKTGEYFSKGQLIAWIIRGGTTLPLHSPINGTVMAINPAIAIDSVLNIVRKDGYLFRMQDAKLMVQLREACGKNSGIKVFTNKMELLKQALQQSFREAYPDKIGTTHADGGAIQLNLEKVMGKQKYDVFLKRIFEGKLITGKS